MSKHLDIDPYVVDTLLPDLVGHDRHPAAFFVYLYLWRQSESTSAREVERSLRDIAEGTGLSRRAVQSALTRLAKRRLLQIERASITAVPSYTVLRPWVRPRRRS